MQFTENLENLKTTSRKDTVVRFLKNNFRVDVDFIVLKKSGQFGRNKQDYFLTIESFQLLQNSYNLRQIDLGKNSMTHPILLTCETATINFLYEMFSDFNLKKQYIVCNYFIDLYFVDLKIAVECYESHHQYTSTYDKIREEIIKKNLNCIIYIYYPNDKNFKLSTVAKEIMQLVYKNKE